AALKRRDLTMTDMEIVRRECRLCTEVGGRGDRPRTVRYGDRKLRNVQVQGHTANMNAAMSCDIASRRYFTKPDYAHAAAAAVIGGDAQGEVFPHQDPPGREIKVDGYPVKFIGTLGKQGNVLGQSQDNVLYMPLTLFSKHIAPSQDIGIFIKAV